MADPRILFIAPRIPYPLRDGLVLRHSHILRAYASVGRVAFAFFYRDETQLGGLASLRPYCETLHPIPLAGAYRPLPPGLSLWGRRLAFAAGRTPMLARFMESPEMQRLVAEMAPSADILHVGRLAMVSNAAAFLQTRRRRPRLVLDLDDIETVVRRRALRFDPPDRWQRRLFEYYDLFRLWQYQRRTLPLFDRVFVCSQGDQRRLRLRNTVVVPNGATLPSVPLPVESLQPTLLFVATLRYQPNADALFFFVREILPLIRKTIPDVHLLAVGASPSPAILALHDGSSISVAADVPDVEPYYRRSTVAIVPLRIGGGTRLRILEAFALGRPVVSTSVGCEGLDVGDGDQLMIRDDPASFAAACIQLLSEAAVRERLVRRARRLVETSYRWESVEERVIKAVYPLLQ